MICLDDVEGMLRAEGTDWVTPDVRPEIIGDINVSPALARWRQELIYGARAKYELAVLQQRKVKEANDRIERCYMDGIGSRVASFHPEIFHRLELCWGRGWWRDKATLHRVLRENPMLQVRAVPRRFSIRVDGLRKQQTPNVQHPTPNGGNRATTISGAVVRGMQGDPTAPANRVKQRRGEWSGHESTTRPDSRRLEGAS